MADLPALMVSPDIFVSGNSLNGRRQAGSILLEAWAHHCGSGRLSLCCGDLHYGQALEPFLRNAGLKGSLQTLLLDDHEALKRAGGIFIPDPAIARWARWRSAFGHNAFSLFGQIHTLSSSASLQLLEALTSEPVQPWDAVFCSSIAGRAVVEAVLSDREQQLRERCGNDALSIPRPELPVVPLPIPVLSLQTDLPPRKLARQALGVPENANVCLWLGRLSMLTKMDPWPTYQLLERVSRQLNQPLWLLECGPDDTPEQRNHFSALRKLCPSVHFLRLGDLQPASEEIKQQALAAADLALSLVDNCQETFGLSVAEAMAAGLPVIASDWDGYRDSVRHGIDGFLIPSQWAPSATACSLGLGWNQLLGSLNYAAAAGALAQLVQVDMAAAAGALTTLLKDSCLRRAMGSAAKVRANQRFASAAVLQQMATVMEELQEKRRQATEASCHFNPPISIDPVRLFRSFASHSSFPQAKGPLPPASVVAARQDLWNFALRHIQDSVLRERLQQEMVSKHL